MSLRRNFSWTLTGSLVYSISQWALILVLANTAGSEALGAFMYALALVSPIALFTDLKLATALATDSRAEYSFGQYAALRLLSIAATVALSLTVLIVRPEIDMVSGMLVLVAITKAAESFSDIHMASMQRLERLDLMSIARMLQGMAVLIAVVVISQFTDNIYWIIGAWSLSACLVMLLYVIPRNSRLLSDVHGFHASRVMKHDWQPEAIWRLIKQTWPLGAAVCLGSMSDYVPRYFIEHFFNLELLGYFSGIGMLIVVGNTVLSALSQTAMPRLANLYHAGDRPGFLLILSRMVGMGLVVGALAIVLALQLGQWVLSVLFGSAFADYSWLLVWFSCLFAIRASYVFVGTGIQAMRNFTVHYRINLAALCTLVLALFYCVERFGFPGVVYALALSTLVEGVFYVVAFWRVFCRASWSVLPTIGILNAS